MIVSDQYSAFSHQLPSNNQTTQPFNSSTPEGHHFSLFIFRFSLLNQFLRVRLSVFDHAHEVQSCRQSGHRDLERRLIRPERAQHPHTAPDLDFVSASLGREHA